MEILKIAIEWAKDEIYSSKFFILFGILFLIGAIGFWQLGKTEMAKAYLYPLLVCGVLLVLVGSGLVYTNYKRLDAFEKVAPENLSTLVASELVRAERTIIEYERIVFKAIPLIIVCFALLLFFSSQPIWRAVSIATIGMMVVVLSIDSNAYQRMKSYKAHLISFEIQKES
ncbi:MAG: hypothetical protein ACON47_01575 [Flavobacteriaceae bacterium]